MDDEGGVRVTGIDIPFADLVWLFGKASLALALVVTLTSWLWVVIGSAVFALIAGILAGIGVPGWFSPAPSSGVPGTPTVTIVTPPPPAPEPVVVAPMEVEPEPPPPAPPPRPVSSDDATEAAIRAELERARARRAAEKR